MHTVRRRIIANAARQAVLDAAGDDDYEAGPAAMKAMRDAVEKYNAEHQIPGSQPRQTEMAKHFRELDPFRSAS